MQVFLCLLALVAFVYSSPTTCSVCDFVVKGAEGLLANNLTESQILHFLDNGCALLPSPLSTECASIVDSAGAAILKDLIEGADPDVICTKFGFCGSKRAVSDVQQGGCSVCQLVVSYVESYLEQNQTEAQIIQQLEQVCSLLGPLGSTCDQFVEQYVPQLIQWIEAGENPATFCKQIGLCGSQKRSVESVQQGGCSVCQLVVSYVESYLAQNQTEAQIIQQLEQVCSLLGPLGSTCDQFVEQYVPQLIQWIEAGESPQVFCQQVGLCASQKQKRDIQQGGCSVCQLVVSYVESYLAQNQTEAQIIQQLEQVCSLLGPLASTCDQFVEQYVPQLIQWIEAGESPQVFCQQVGLCASQKRDVQQGGCSVCQLVVSYVESYLAQNQTEAQIIQQLEQVCSLLGPLASTCDQFVEQYVPQLIQWIEAGESPQVFCQQVGLCGSQKRAVSDIQQGGCSVCQLVVSYVESYLEQNQTEAQIVQQLEQVCSLLGPLASTCDQFVEQYVPQLIQWIEAGENPATFCKQIGLCSAYLVKRDIQQGGCSVCQLVVSYVESYLAQNQSEAQIIQQLEQVCSLLGPLASTCDQFVEQYVPQLIQWIEAGESPQVFCQQVGLCAASLKRSIQQGGGCSVCQLVVSYVENFLKSNGSIAQLEQELDQLCSLLGPLSGTCDNFVALYTPQLVEWIINNEPPQQFCAQVGLCSAPTKVYKTKVNLKEGANCGLCELVVQYVELYLAASGTEKQIIATVEQLCTFLPASIERQCNNIIEANLPNLIQAFIKKENPLTFCTQVGLCPSNQ